MKPNKEKCYGYNTDGNWTYWYETSSIVTCYIDGHQIDSCGSTIIFKDKRIEPCDIKFDEINVSDEYWDYESSIDVENKLSAEDYIKIRFWWDTQKANGKTPKSRLVVVQSQKGNPITMFVGDEVTWSFSSLPKTTHIVIDGMDLYLHRSNYAIIDTELLSSN